VRFTSRRCWEDSIQLTTGAIVNEVKRKSIYDHHQMIDVDQSAAIPDLTAFRRRQGVRSPSLARVLKRCDGAHTVETPGLGQPATRHGHQAREDDWDPSPADSIMASSKPGCTKEAVHMTRTQPTARFTRSKKSLASRVPSTHDELSSYGSTSMRFGLILNRINPDLKKVMIYESGLQARPPCGPEPAAWTKES
jgi:hypothetical protein